ncbi:MAG: hypothetical protein M9924_10080 [Rhizobiaceae bacterium]|nr:hypothetical protein [Rhizobiaceae bacterium]
MRTVLLGIATGINMLGMLATASAASLEAAQGAWTMNGTSCEDTFQNVNGTIEFKNRDSSQNTGILVKGNEILGPLATCRADQVQEQGDHLVAYLSCSDSILMGGFSVAFQILDGGRLKRFDTMFPDISVIYQKCDL